jgi:hypothetical protein
MAYILYLFPKGVIVPPIVEGLMPPPIGGVIPPPIGGVILPPPIGGIILPPEPLFISMAQIHIGNCGAPAAMSGCAAASFLAVCVALMISLMISMFINWSFPPPVGGYWGCWG